MCKTCGKGYWAGCATNNIAKGLLIVGGLNWGLVGAGMIAGDASSWNLVSILLGSWPTVESAVYVLVALAAIVALFGCRCRACKAGTCNVCAVGEKCSCGGDCMNGKCNKCGADCGAKKM